MGGTASVTCPDGKFTMVANAKPVPLDLNDDTQVTYSGLNGVDYDDEDEFMKTAPQIQMWDGTGYTKYYYLNDAYVDDENSKKGWADFRGEFVTSKIEVGRGFWVKAVTGEFTVNFAK